MVTFTLGEKKDARGGAKRAGVAERELRRAGIAQVRGAFGGASIAGWCANTGGRVWCAVCGCERKGQTRGKGKDISRGEKRKPWITGRPGGDVRREKVLGATHCCQFSAAQAPIQGP